MKAIQFHAKPQEDGGYILWGHDLETREDRCYGYFPDWFETESAILRVLDTGEPRPEQAA